MPRGPKKGQPPNNPHGRPPKERALTEQLRIAFGKAGPGGTPRKDIMAEFIAEAATTGMVAFPDGRVLKLSPRDWLDTVWKVYAQVDGPPRQEIDMSVDQVATVKGYVGFTPDEWDARAPDEDGP